VKKLRTVRSEITLIRSLRSASASEIGREMASPVRVLAAQLEGNETLSAQLEAVRLNGVHTNGMIEWCSHYSMIEWCSH
jgi:hypothetical protein